MNSNLSTHIAPTAIPSSLLGTLHYYQWREADRRQRFGTINASYYSTFGDKYARRFMESTYHQLSMKGKQWALSVLIDLQQQLESLLLKEPTIELSPAKFKWTVWTQHFHSYKKAGFYQLSLRDQWIILRSIDIRDYLLF